MVPCFALSFLSLTLCVVSSVGAFSGYPSLCGGASAGSSGASAGRSVFVSRLRQLSLERTVRLFSFRAFHRFPNIAANRRKHLWCFRLYYGEQGKIGEGGGGCERIQVPKMPKIVKKNEQMRNIVILFRHLPVCPIPSFVFRCLFSGRANSVFSDFPLKRVRRGGGGGSSKNRRN